jgi:hypothetical protein
MNCSFIFFLLLGGGLGIIAAHVLLWWNDRKKGY